MAGDACITFRFVFSALPVSAMHHHYQQIGIGRTHLLYPSFRAREDGTQSPPANNEPALASNQITKVMHAIIAFTPKNIFCAQKRADTRQAIDAKTKRR
jgi:hypothetical protein